MKNNSFGQKLLLGAILGWVCAILLVFLIFGEVPRDEASLRIIGFLSLAPGSIIGLIVTYFLNKPKKNETIDNNQTTIHSRNKSVSEQLTELKSLLDNGVLNQEEFNNQKSIILGQKANDISTPVSTPKPTDTSVPKEKSISDKLIELKALLDNNAISEKEYEAIKQDLLKKL